MEAIEGGLNFSEYVTSRPVQHATRQSEQVSDFSHDYWPLMSGRKTKVVSGTRGSHSPRKLRRIIKCKKYKTVLSGLYHLLEIDGQT